VPAALTRALAVLAQRGVLVVHADAVETLAGASHVVFDKTGTLTEPQTSVDRIDVFRDLSRDDALALAASLARGSRHPLSRAIANAAGDAPVLVTDDIEEIAGHGLRGRVGVRELCLGHAAFALRNALHDATLDDAVVLADDHGAIAAFHVGEQLRPGVRAALDALTADGLAVEIVSGDAPSKVAALAQRLGIAQWRARQTPADKLVRLAELRAGGARVVAVGDGVNDAPVLAGADVAIALGGGSELAQASSDIVLAQPRLAALPEALSIAHETMRVLRQNQRWALAYNLIVVPFGALGFVPPWLAALGMSASSLIVVLNATRIGRRMAPRHEAAPREALA
jgi:Cu2+-exporting ATPase